MRHQKCAAKQNPWGQLDPCRAGADLLHPWNTCNGNACTDAAHNWHNSPCYNDIALCQYYQIQALTSAGASNVKKDQTYRLKSLATHVAPGNPEGSTTLCRDNTTRSQLVAVAPRKLGLAHFHGVFWFSFSLLVAEMPMCESGLWHSCDDHL